MKKSLVQSVLFAGFAIVALAMAGGCGGGGGGLSGELPNIRFTGSLSGYIYTPSTSRVMAQTTSKIPLVNAVVTCSNRTANTNSSGYFKIDFLQTGIVNCTVTKAGYNTFEFTATVTSGKETVLASDINIYVEGEYDVSVSVSPTSGTTSTSFTATCVYEGGTPSKVEMKCDESMSWSDVTASKKKTCVYSAEGSYTPGCRLDSDVTGSVASDVVVTGGSSSISVAASVSPTSGTTSTTFTLTCTVSGGTATTLEGRCDDADSWSTISSGITKSCTYASSGSYTPGCQVNGTTSDNVDSDVTVTGGTSPTVTASVAPSSGTTATTYVLTCTVTGTAATLEGRCDDADSWAAISSGITKNCTYTSSGSYTPGCRVDSSASDDVDSPVTVAAVTTVSSFTPAASATGVAYDKTVFKVVFSAAMDATVNLNNQATLTASGFSITIQNQSSGSSLTINTANALSYGVFAWTTTTATNDTLSFTLKSNAVLTGNGLKTLKANTVYNITARTVPTNLEDSSGNAIDTTTNIPATGSFTTSATDAVAPVVLSFTPADGATNVPFDQPSFSVLFDDSMDSTVDLNNQATLTASSFSISIQKQSSGTILTINAANALNYGVFAWSTTNVADDTLEFTLLPNATLTGNGLKTLMTGELYNITSRTIPSNLEDDAGNALSTAGIATSGSFTTQ